MTRQPFEPGEILHEVGRFGGGILRLALHYFTPPDQPARRVPWLDVSAKKDSASPFKAVTVKPRELRALGQAMIAAADRLEAEGFGAAPPPEQHRTERATDHFRKPGARRG